MRYLLLALFLVSASAPSLAAKAHEPRMMTTRCSADNPRVWVNTDTHVYHIKGDKYYGKTQHGTFMCKRSAIGAHNHISKSTDQ